MSGIGNFILYGAIEYFCCMADLHKKTLLYNCKNRWQWTARRISHYRMKASFFAIEQNKST